MNNKEILDKIKLDSRVFNNLTFNTLCAGHECDECKLDMQVYSSYGCSCRHIEYKAIAEELFKVLESELYVTELTVDQISELLGYKVKVVGTNGEDSNE